MIPVVTREQLHQIDTAVFEIPVSTHPEMRVPAQVIVNETLLDEILQDRSLMQLVNVATLPGIVRAAYAMPDIHQGYGFPIGGVAATDIHQDGIISPGGIGYDINCGVRLLSIGVSAQEVQKILPTLATALNREIPSGVGTGGNYKLSPTELNEVLTDGAQYWVKRDIGTAADLEFCEENGQLGNADPDAVSNAAKKRGRDQLGTLGSGNHFVELQQITTVYDEQIAAQFGLHKGMITAMIHCGSRGLGHQTCTDAVQDMIGKLSSWNIALPDRELACAPFFSPEGQRYFGAMNAAANFAWANRHLIGHAIRSVCNRMLGSSVPVRTIYDVCHNIGKRETHVVNGIPTELLVHRKGATRAFPAHTQGVPPAYNNTGHPVFVPGTMGTASYVLVGLPSGMERAFGSCCHGAGRRMSRTQARATIRGSALRGQLEKQGIIVRCHSDKELSEEAPFAYKDVHDVVSVVEQAGIARRVVELKPIAVIKGG